MGNKQTRKNIIKDNIQKFDQKTLHILIVNGYIREESAKIHLNIPTEIIKLVFSYHFELKCITFNGDVIKALQNGTTLVI